MLDNLRVLKKALDIFRERGITYDTPASDVEVNYERAAAIASLWLNKPVLARDVVLIMASVKMSRTAVVPDHEDSFVDMVNYISFGAAFSVPKTEPPRPAPRLRVNGEDTDAGGGS